jgi:predicted CxxxxCH...CXXCH cytochrome family protein
MDCVACHQKPADALAAGHVDGIASVTGYTGTDPALAAAVRDPGWNEATASCGTAYCHGATIPTGANKTPLWTAPSGTEATCGTCHGNPPTTGLHYDHIGGGNWYASANCSNCHSGIATGSGNAPVTNAAIVAPTLHVNGTKDVVFGGYYSGFKVQGYPAGQTLRWDPTAKTCSNVSCHRMLPDQGWGPYHWNP